MRLTAILAAALMMGAAAVSAHADTTYSWNAGQDAGTFTTGAASPIGSGYFLLSDFYFVTADAGDMVYTNEDITNFFYNASFNPTIDSFGNNYSGGFYNDTGGFFNNDIGVNPIAVGLGVQISDSNDSGYSSANFTVISGLPVSAAPEPSTWLLMMAGVAMLGGMLRLGKRAQTSAVQATRFG